MSKGESSQTHFFPHSISEFDHTVAQAKRAKILPGFLSLLQAISRVCHSKAWPPSTHIFSSPAIIIAVPLPWALCIMWALAACPAHGVRGPLLSSDLSVESCGPKNKIYTPRHSAQSSPHPTAHTYCLPATLLPLSSDMPGSLHSRLLHSLSQLPKHPIQDHDRNGNFEFHTAQILPT